MFDDTRNTKGIFKFRQRVHLFSIIFNITTMESTQNSIAMSLSARSKSIGKSHHGMFCSFKKTLKEYASSSSAHGIAYIFEPDRLGLERLLWIFVVGFALIFRYSVRCF